MALDERLGTYLTCRFGKARAGLHTQAEPPGSSVVSFEPLPERRTPNIVGSARVGPYERPLFKRRNYALR